MNKLTPKIKAKIKAQYPDNYIEIEKILVELCDDIICSEPGLLSERICAAILKDSAGDIDNLYGCIELANTDWRDMLMDADFGEDVDAHLEWLK